ncbi:hypothetical protein JHK82_016285 [Glycine max]|uniref:Uncharacterized protein n=2 Tax=Glycine subgen. Soja TaxID=1462606 RepID=K7KX00_SOYBN|nr:hypothetical protein JHK85_016693 [Glycine max]KHN18292.1 hypothetical protein glysoja_035723 [Glycine soja]KAG5046927.1 hypothetical protein JHK86_016333 [Glycine max]KAG5149404.1 hypothetical protein JHK82_016285 [Glycine max]KAH1127357.1 hypothetical protein GYH30_016084 [Glycine max]
MKDELIIQDLIEIEQHVLEFYTNLFATDNNIKHSDLVEKVIPSLITPKENTLLTNLRSFEEVQLAVFG